ncbi:MAG TPA: DUF502 domain-containing protein [Pirellulales bacterium]|nr:DUF502 domain-containing protein [Pirellulales bacterium]
MPSAVKQRSLRRQSRWYPVRRAILSGLGVVMPPLLTVVIFLWVGGTIKQYALEPVTIGARNLLAWYWERQDDRMFAEPEPARMIRQQQAEIAAPNGRKYVRLSSGAYLPEDVLKVVSGDDPAATVASGSRRAIYRRYAELEYLQPRLVIPLFLCLFLLFLYLLGKFLAAGIGRVVWNLIERGILRLPLVRNVYDSVKQVTDFMFSDRELEYTRVVAVEYPRKGVWSIAFVTGESLLDIRAATGEPMLSLMIPSSPMSVTGYTITVPKSDTIDLNLTVDQALQFVISCGVVVPAHQLQRQSSLEAAR